MRQFRGKKIKPGKRTFVCNSYCLKCGDLIYINSGKHRGNIAEVESMQNYLMVISKYDLHIKHKQSNTLL